MEDSNSIYLDLIEKTAFIQTVQQILDSLPAEAKEKIRNTKKDGLSLFHFGLGTWIRNNILTKDSGIYYVFIENEILHKDDMSEIIIRELHKSLCKTEANKK